MRELEEILKSVIEAEPGKVANTVKAALEEGGAVKFLGCGILTAAIANIDERLQKLEGETTLRRYTP